MKVCISILLKSKLRELTIHQALTPRLDKEARLVKLAAWSPRSMSSMSSATRIEFDLDPVPMMGVLHASDKLLPSSAKFKVKNKFCDFNGGKKKRDQNVVLDEERQGTFEAVPRSWAFDRIIRMDASGITHETFSMLTYNNNDISSSYFFVLSFYKWLLLLFVSL